MLQKVRTYIEEKNLIRPGDHVIAGVSGGADSVCLLLVLKELSELFPFTLFAVHVEHGIRGEESRKDAAFVENFCNGRNIPCRFFSVDAPAEAEKRHVGLEEAARALRYECFAKAADETGANRIAVAHHIGDAAETILFHLCRGTGIRGLAGIPSERGRIIRPLLCVTREEIENFLRERQQPYCTDITNTDTGYARNRIRMNILPEMEKINARSLQHMKETAEEVSEIADFLEREAERLGERCTERDTNGILILRQPFLEMDPVLQKCRMHQLLGEAAGSRKDLTRRHIEIVTRLFSMQTGRKISLPYGLTAQAEYKGVRITCNREKTLDIGDPGRPNGCQKETGKAGTDHAKAAKQAELVIIEPHEGAEAFLEGPDGSVFAVRVFFYDGNAKKIPQTRYTKWFDYDKLKDSLQIRFRQPGDYLQISPEGGRKKLKEWMVNEKIPSARRCRIPLVAMGSHILWIVGYRSSEAFRVSKDTNRILEIRLVERRAEKVHDGSEEKTGRD